MTKKKSKTRGESAAGATGKKKKNRMAYSESTKTDATLEADIGLGNVRDYFALLKPRVMSLVVFTALVGWPSRRGTSIQSSARPH